MSKRRAVAIMLALAVLLALMGGDPDTLLLLAVVWALLDVGDAVRGRRS